MKPHIFRANGGWLCKGRKWSFYGATPKEAFAKVAVAERLQSYLDKGLMK